MSVCLSRTGLKSDRGMRRRLTRLHCVPVQLFMAKKTLCLVSDTFLLAKLRHGGCLTARGNWQTKEQPFCQMPERSRMCALM